EPHHNPRCNHPHPRSHCSA
ncbi:MAG: hypothetical protein AVDCRST_MAG93-8821, partial [uncultured Chloroflexia bacterium]